MKILVVEDDLTTRLLVRSCVEKMGHAAICCSGGQMALTVLKDNPDIGLVVTDILMPDLDGRELVKTIRADSELSGMPVIMISGTVKLSEINQLLALGMSRFLAKPVRVEELRQDIFSLLEERKRARRDEAAAH